MGLLEKIKKGNTSSGVAAVGNIFLAGIKAVAASISGSGTMFASAMHSLADSINQGFVFFGSVLAELPPTKRFPTGFGRVINIFCMIAVVVVTIMAYETIKEGWHLLQHPIEATNFFLNIIILLISFFVDGFILVKAMKEIRDETGTAEKGGLIRTAFQQVRKAAPATRLVFYEDLVATFSAVLAIIGIVLAQFFNVLAADGIASIIIGILMLYVAYRVGYDNMAGLIGVAAPAEVEENITNIILGHKDIVDIQQIRIIQEGRLYHVEGTIELRKGMMLDEADDVQIHLRNMLLNQPDVADVVLGILEDDGKINWK
ncbi:cation diffusion facilitator family transporter [Oceanobacillus alkalisoli]|uniref:cation diffusion facilitator family transporter n=1 Tax=Oceanobacillus alkalisoli TaxID=2925113 RepID=UPI001F121594|nr:cation diffusion facilitator family transporter [Oceanobacillus alkalisoli]MCF3943389.1 cation diffusion facilitator family transporter [Oceanobacillus alkalisoli]